MTEEFLHHVWKYRLFTGYNLTTVSGDEITIVKTGTHNTDSGPDFSDARIKIGSTLWVGNVEIHINSSDWNKHKHHTDEAYNNVILHVVFNNDQPVQTASKRLLPTLVLKDKINAKVYGRYKSFLSNTSWIPCEKQITDFDEFIKNNWLERLTVERLERKSQLIAHDLKLYGNDWNEVFYFHLVKNFGMKINAEPFTMLAKSLPYSILCKHKDDLLQIEALLFGQSGLLNSSPALFDSGDNYFYKLKNEYDFLKKKYALQTMNYSSWKFMRMRPLSFPTIRIAQLAGLIFKNDFLLSGLIDCKMPGQLFEFFKVKASEFWNDHYTFEKKSENKIKKLGSTTVEMILINTVIPFLFVYGKQRGNEEFCERAITFLSQLPAEKNAITKSWEKIKFLNHSAFSSQALLELKNEYCSRKRCLNCGIGTHLLKS